jgi:hypothetical protein
LPDSEELECSPVFPCFRLQYHYTSHSPDRKSRKLIAYIICGLMLLAQELNGRRSSGQLWTDTKMGSNVFFTSPFGPAIGLLILSFGPSIMGERLFDHHCGLALRTVKFDNAFSFARFLFAYEILHIHKFVPTGPACQPVVAVTTMLCRHMPWY